MPMKIAFETATKLIRAALPLAVTPSLALAPAEMLWSMSEHWNTRLDHTLTTVIAISAERLPGGLSIGCGVPWRLVAPADPDLCDAIDEE
jgi:hypothetical protein